jgi:hypothetical protein
VKNKSGPESVSGGNGEGALENIIGIMLAWADLFPMTPLSSGVTLHENQGQWVQNSYFPTINVATKEDWRAHEGKGSSSSSVRAGSP